MFLFKTLFILSLSIIHILADDGYSQPSSSYVESYSAPEKPMPYEFGYETDDGYGSKQSRQENQDSYGNLKGSYSYTDAYGLYRTVEYTAGPEGFKANIKTNEPGVEAKDPADVYVTALEPPAKLYQPQYAQPAQYPQAAQYAPASKPRYAAPYTPRASYKVKPQVYQQVPYEPKTYSAAYVRSYERRPVEYKPEPIYAVAKANYENKETYEPVEPQEEYKSQAVSYEAKPVYKPSVPQYKAVQYQTVSKYPAPVYPQPKLQLRPHAAAPKYEVKYVQVPQYAQVPAAAYQEQPQQHQRQEQAYQVPEYQATANYGQQRQYAQQAIRAAYRRTKKQAYDPAYSGDIDTANTSLKAAVEYVDA